jgi:mRNA interferase MazF
MEGTVKTSIELPASLLDAVDRLALALERSPGELVETAIADYIRKHQTDHADPAVHQGDIYMLLADDAADSDIAHPHVVIQDDVLNGSRLETVVVCALTSNMNKVSVPGNVLLDAGEADLTRQSVVEVTKVSTVTKSQLGAYIGRLSAKRIEQIRAGMRLVQASYWESR